MKAIEQYFPVVLDALLYSVVLTFEAVDETLKSDHSNESCWAVLSCGTECVTTWCGSHYWGRGWNLNVWTMQMKAIEQYFPVVLFVLQYSVILTFQSVHDTSNDDDSSDSYWAALYSFHSAAWFCTLTMKQPKK